MKFAFLAVSAAALLVAAPAFAQTTGLATTSVQVTGNVGAQCGVGNQSGGGTRSIGPAIALPDVVNASGQLDTVTTTAIGFDNIWCNGGHNQLMMDVSALTLQSPPTSFDSSSFVSAVDMNVTGDGTHRILTTYFGIPSLQSSGATDGKANVGLGAFETGTLTFSEALLSLKMPTSAHDAGVRPLAGTYTGSVTITVTPGA